MEKVKKTIVKLFAVIAVAIALLMCGVLLGCGVKPDGETDNKNPIDTVTPGGDGVDDEEQQKPADTDEHNDGIIMVPESPAMNGCHIKVECEEECKFDIDEVLMDLIYGVDIDLFNNMARGTFAQQRLENCGIYFCAYNLDDYFYKSEGKNSGIFNHEKLYANLSSLENGDVKDGVYLIEKIPHEFKNGYYLGDKLMYADEQFLTLDNLIDTDYEAEIKDNPYAVICHKRITVELPRELFTAESGRIYINVLGYGNYCRDDRVYVNTIADGPCSRIIFDYKVIGDEVMITVLRSGCSDIVDSTHLNLKSRMKSNYNVKLADVNNETQETIQVQSETQCVGVEGTIKWIDNSENSHPAQYIKIDAYSWEEESDNFLGTCYTDVHGNYSLDFSESNVLSDNVYINVNAASDNVIVYNSLNNEYVHSTKNSIIPDFWNERAQIDVDFDMSAVFGQALQVSQAAITASRYATMLNGHAFPTVKVFYPYGTGASFYNDKGIHINGARGIDLQPYESWDAIMHEYGHYVQKQLGITQSQGGTHVSSINMEDHYYEDSIKDKCVWGQHLAIYSPAKCKYMGVSISWAEAWATSFSFRAQFFFKDILDDNIRTVCDTIYQSSNIDIDSYYDYETIQSKGEGTEEAIIGFLWDLFDDYNEDEPFDNIMLSDEAIWNYVVTPHVKVFADLITYIYNTNDIPRDNLAALLDKYEMNVGNLRFYYVNDNNLPAFSWNPRGGSEYYPNNLFELKVYDNSKNLLFSHENLRANSYVVTYAELNILLKNNDNFYWTVDAYQLDDDKGGDYLTGPFVSSMVSHGQICEYRKSMEEITGVIDSNTPCKYYKYVSVGYMLGDVIVVGNNGMNINCTVYSSPISSTSNRINGSGSTVVLPHEFKTGGATAFVFVKSENGVTGTFSIKINNHSHSYNSYTKIDSTNHIKSCACGAKVTEAHSLGSAVFKDPKYHAFKCKCGYEKLGVHVFRTSGGWEICRTCGHTKRPGQDIMGSGVLC